MAYQEKQLTDISKKFQIYGEILHAETLKIGHINETYSATYDQGGMRVRLWLPSAPGQTPADGGDRRRGEDREGSA